MRPHQLPPDQLLHLLLWATVILAALLLILVLLGGIYQYGRDRANRHRIACYQAWEEDLATYLFGGGHERGLFPAVPRRDRILFQRFLSRYQATLAGQEAALLRRIYREQGGVDTLPRRLKHPSDGVRAEAILEISAFQVNEYLDVLFPLLKDPTPYVAQLAAQALAHSQQRRFAAPVMDWVLTQDRYQQERLLRILEGFGPQLLSWMVEHPPTTQEAPEFWILYASLAATHRTFESLPTLQILLQATDIDLLATTLRALAAIAIPQTYEQVKGFAHHEAWPVRAQAARAMGLLGGPIAIGELLPLLTDPVYEVRRNAAQGLADMGHAGTSALEWTAADPEADRFACDIARERLEWSSERGHL